MNLRLLHRRLAVLMAFSGLVAFTVGAGAQFASAALGGAALLVAVFWQPTRELSARMERLWLPLAVLLVGRALFHLFVVRDDVVVPVVDLLLLLLAAEALRSLDARNDVRLYSLSFALLLAATAYRPGILFAVAFVTYVGLATTALLVGHVKRQGERHGVASIPVERPFLLTVAGLSGITLLTSALVFLAFPRVSQGWAGRAPPPSMAIAGFSDEVALGTHGSRIQGNPQIVLRVEFPESRPTDPGRLYWRGRSYDFFDGFRWSRSRGLTPARVPAGWYEERWGGEDLRQDIYAAPLAERVLFTLHPTVALEASSGIHPLLDNAGDFTYWGSAAPAYTAWSRPEPPPPDSLREEGEGYTPGRRYYLQLPRLDRRVHALADSLSAPYSNSYDRAAAIQRWFREEFEYTLDLPATPGEATLEHFLFVRRAGHCEYFSTAMVILLRSVGIPAREVNGFLGGEWNEFGRYLAVTQNQAHSWVEIWFPRYGWVGFDPTPPGSASDGEARVWFWPGRFLLDGLQHRWNKWILDYNLGTQSNLLQRTAGFLGGEGEALEGGASDGQQRRWTIWWAAALMAGAALGLSLFLRRTSGLAPESVLYLKLRARYARAGLPGAESLTPLALLDGLRDGGYPGLPQAERLVRLYLESRFGGRPAGEDARREMSAALVEVRRAFRRA